LAVFLSDPYKARPPPPPKHGTVIKAMPTIPVSNAKDLPADVPKAQLVWDETLAAGEYCSRVLPRGTRLRLINLDGDACVNFLVYNADHPIERLNVADTVKVQWNAYLGEGKLLLSDMGRVLMSITKDTCGKHDTFCGASNEKTNTAKYGAGANYSPCPNARDRFAIALHKHGLGRKDIAPSVNFFKGVEIDDNGNTFFNEKSSKPGDVLELRAEMNVLVLIANTPHVLDPRPNYTASDLRVLAWHGQVTAGDDSIRNTSPESQRAFENNEDYYL
jgi:urea carboxylase-associated protein 2